MHVCNALGGKKRGSGALQLVLQLVVSPLVAMATELRSPAKLESA